MSFAYGCIWEKPDGGYGPLSGLHSRLVSGVVKLALGLYHASERKRRQKKDDAKRPDLTLESNIKLVTQMILASNSMHQTIASFY